MFGFLRKSPTWSVAFAPEGSSLVWAVIKNTIDGPILHAYGKSFSTEEALGQVRGVAKDKVYEASVFPGVSTLCRSLVLPALKGREVRAAVLDTLDQTISLTMEESVFAYESNQARDGSWAIASYVIQQAALTEHLKTVGAQGIDPEFVLPKAACLSAFMAHFSPSGWHYVVDIGAEETTVILSFEKKVVESTSLVGGSSVFDAIENPTASNEEALYQLLQHLREITTAYQERYELPEETSLTITGESSASSIEAIRESIGAPLSDLHAAGNKMDTSFLSSASAVGAAFLAAPDRSQWNSPNFRTGHFAFALPLLHWKKPLIAFTACSFLLAGAFVWYGNEQASSIARSMSNEWRRITTFSHTTPEIVLNAAEKEGILFDQEEVLSPEGLVRQGEWFLSDVEKRALFPLHPDIPRLSDFLTWLGGKIEEAQKEEGAESISLDSCHYVLSSRPTKTHPLEKYLVRVDIDVSTASAVAARALHNKLISPNPFVETSSDVKWSGNNNKYKASFVLKDRTLYPTKTP